MIKVPFNELKLINKKYKKKFLYHVSDCIEKSNFIKGKYNRILDEIIKKKFQIKHSLLVKSGTDALIVALRSFNFKKNDEVITTANTWISSAYAISLNGATPVFVDINQNNFQMDIDCFKRK